MDIANITLASCELACSVYVLFLCKQGLGWQLWDWQAGGSTKEQMHCDGGGSSGGLHPPVAHSHRTHSANWLAAESNQTLCAVVEEQKYLQSPHTTLTSELWEWSNYSWGSVACAQSVKTFQNRMATKTNISPAKGSSTLQLHVTGQITQNNDNTTIRHRAVDVSTHLSVYLS